MVGFLLGGETGGNYRPYLTNHPILTYPDFLPSFLLLPLHQRVPWESTRETEHPRYVQESDRATFPLTAKGAR
ncbi:hypothetical protein E2C01_015636 [Portunus trituberculatus]|uniref:Uncharacterized protein n=1 Tax=Portunus trituberculatus TaxID=210409 RepID=A0A5B7DMG0_PORTR|nr:hypothetical protein [Portunus trituberculatus]